MESQQNHNTTQPALVPEDNRAPVPEHKRDVALASSRFLPGWQNAGRPLRQRFQGKGYVLKSDSVTHREFKASKGKKGVKQPPERPAYSNPKFGPWQAEMARALHDGRNVIADVVTSCGKTWAANLITGYEILSRDTAKGSKATGLIISPNSEVMRDSVKDICEHHNKIYQYGGTKMLDTMTRNFSTYDERRGPHAQIMVVAVECIEDFITDPVQKDFVEKLEIIVFDEVHLGPVTRALWWSQYIPHTAQLVLLSATLGDPGKVQQIVIDIQSLQKGRPRETHIIKYDVRPIPLQPLVFRGLSENERPEAGVKSKNLKGAKKLACLPNIFDPTERDILSLLVTAGTLPVIPMDREEQFKFGQQVISEKGELSKQKIMEGLDGAQLDPNAKNIYDLLCYLFVNDKAPAMVFNTTAGATEHLCRTLVGHIAETERADDDYRTAEKQFQIYEKEQYRTRDKKSHCKALEKEKDASRRDWSKALPEEPASEINIHEIRKTLRKHRFPSDLQDRPVPENIPQWIRDALEYGIGVYVSSMKIWQRHYMFDAFRDGKLRVLLSDATISVGINLPIRTVIMCGSMSHALYKQASGRAGRRGMDNQGFIVHMMPKNDVIKCLTTKTPVVHLNMPERMNHADLIRILVPENLQDYYYIDPYIAKKTGESVPVFDDSEAKCIPGYSRKILDNYLGSLNDKEHSECLEQIRLIHTEQWHYHRLTNIVKTLPEQTSIILVKMLALGVLHDFDLGDFYHLMGMLFNRVEWDETRNPEDFYVPDLDPVLMKKITKSSEVYGLNIDYTKRIHRYFYDFCRKHIVYPELLPQIEAMGEWLYTFKIGVMAVCPKEGHGRNAKPMDKFVNMLLQADQDYLAARTSKSI
jgi:superfamily II DNA or RNA helicase